MTSTPKLSDYKREWYHKNKEKVKARRIVRYYEDPAAAVEAARKWRVANPERRRTTARKNHLQKKYGITPEQHAELFVSQGSACAICHTTEEPATGWHTDHCHKTGKVRGILCSTCNTSLGGFKDNPEILASAIEYLRKNNDGIQL